MPFDQKTRSLRIKASDLGADDQMILTSFSASESISRLFSFQIEFLSLNLNLAPDKVIGKSVTIEVAEKNVGDRGDADVRYFHGYVSRFSAGSAAPEKGPDGAAGRIYTAEIVPWVWFLTQKAQSHIFFPDKSEKSVHDVIEEVLNRPVHTGKSNWEFKGAADLKSRMMEHCVQYRETDFNFVSRILEQFGAYYYFEHSDGDHKLIISTNPTTAKCKESEVEFRRNDQRSIKSWLHSFEFVTGNYEHADYNFETPLDNLKTDSPKVGQLVPASADYTVYDYPGEFSDKGVGKDEARIRQEEEEVPHSTIQGTSGYRSFSTGHKFKLTYHPEEDGSFVKGDRGEKGEYMLTAVHHHASEPYLDGGGTEYSNSFSCILRRSGSVPQESHPSRLCQAFRQRWLQALRGKRSTQINMGGSKSFFIGIVKQGTLKTAKGRTVLVGCASPRAWLVASMGSWHCRESVRKS